MLHSEHLHFHVLIVKVIIDMQLHEQWVLGWKFIWELKLPGRIFELNISKKKYI